jgi:hypothetical protein
VWSRSRCGLSRSKTNRGANSFSAWASRSSFVHGRWPDHGNQHQRIVSMLETMAGTEMEVCRIVCAIRSSCNIILSSAHAEQYLIVLQRCHHTPDADKAAAAKPRPLTCGPVDVDLSRQSRHRDIALERLASFEGESQCSGELIAELRRLTTTPSYRWYRKPRPQRWPHPCRFPTTVTPRVKRRRSGSIP